MLLALFFAETIGKMRLEDIHYVAYIHGDNARLQLRELDELKAKVIGSFYLHGIYREAANKGNTVQSRTELLKALKMCKRKGATLLLMRSNQLLNNLEFIALLMEHLSHRGNASIYVHDKNFLQETGRGTNINLDTCLLLARQRKIEISNRTKQALQDARVRGIELGAPKNTLKNLSKAGVVAKKRYADDFAKRVMPHIKAIRQEGGESLRAIARGLTARGVTTRMGGDVWHPTMVQNILKRSKPGEL